MKLHRDLNVTQKTAWFLAHRIRKAFADRHDGDSGTFSGPVEVGRDLRGQRVNMSNAQRKALAATGRGTAGKTAMAGMKNRDTNRVRADVVETTDTDTLQGFVEHNARTGATVHTDEAAVYRGLTDLCCRHESVQHPAGEYVKHGPHERHGELPVDAQRGYIGVYHKMSPKHLGRYVAEFSPKAKGRHNLRRSDTRRQMARVGEGMVGKQMRYNILIVDNGLPSGARS